MIRPPLRTESLVYLLLAVLSLLVLTLVALSPSFAMDNKVIYQGF
ncbi:MAG: hypothetical protein P4L99_12370 [Chthoniobacter sp.]|nr:hypothetical protein [Chthoniobacter sp.]